MHSTSTTTIGENRRGGRRIWLEGRRLDRSGFHPATRYEVSTDPVARTVTLRVAANGGRTVSRRSKGDRDTPIVDICGSDVLSAFEGIGTLRVRFEDGAIVMTPLASEMRRIERAARLERRLSDGEPLAVGSVSTGLGVLALAIHQGLEKAGVDSTLAFSVEIDERYQEHCASANPVWTDGTVAIAAPMQEVAHDPVLLAALPQVDILEAGIPCTAHSLAGRAKKALARPEDDPAAGHLVSAFLTIVAACNPAVVIVENVPEYMASASFSILRGQLEEWGYDVRSTVLSGEEFGCLERRDRMALVACTSGIDVDLETLAPSATPSRTLSEILDDVPDDDPRWSSMDHLRRKEIRDEAEGKGFRMQIFDKSSTAVSTIGRGYSKVRSTEPKIRHPETGLLRQLTPHEHARIKGVPTSMVNGVAASVAHEMLGQSVLAAPFRALGERIGGAARAWLDGTPAPRGEIRVRPCRPLSDLPLFAC